MSNQKSFCVYLTVYKGNKLPPFYIGWSSNVNKVLAGKYRGSVDSERYKPIWKQEIKNHPELFKTIILSLHETEEQAKYREEFLQRKLKVINNPLYVNLTYGHSRLGGSKENNGMFGKTHSETAKNSISIKNSGRVIVKDVNGNVFKIEKEEFEKRKNIDLFSAFKDSVICKDLQGNILKVSKEEFDKRKGIDLFGVAANTVTCKDKEGNNFRISKEEFDKRKGIDLFAATEGRIIPIEERVRIGNIIRESGCVLGEKNGMYGKHHTEEHKKYISELFKDTVMVHHLTFKVTKRIKKDLLNDFLNDGWIKGRLPKSKV